MTASDQSAPRPAGRPSGGRSAAGWTGQERPCGGLPCRDVAEHRSLGDVTTLTDSSVMELIRDQLPASVGGEDEDGR
ncbi:hypothetical protein [Kitasatospora arboriphila]|uniref:FXSXX-COOH protein n=1 Tax=Kitasatospora arboriphila TaxID=258052 RepID=A0ABP4E413_9ACTN